jgi:hypothetical protein
VGGLFGGEECMLCREMLWVEIVRFERREVCLIIEEMISFTDLPISNRNKKLDSPPNISPSALRPASYNPIKDSRQPRCDTQQNDHRARNDHGRNLIPIRSLKPRHPERLRIIIIVILLCIILVP